VAKVLVIDEQQHLLEYLRFNLQRSGLEVHAAQSSREGWRLAMALQPELLVVDERMHLPDGSSLAESLRGAPELAGSRVITIAPRNAAVSEQPTAGSSLKLPFRPSELLALLRSAG
jgi:two-component system alkaline phosphatase synthesis response regulator PhoP